MEKIRYVQRVKTPGAVYLYFRKGDYREGPLASPEGSEELRAEVQAILHRLAGIQAAQQPKPGTVGGMLKAYAGAMVDGKRTPASADFLVLARSTQALYHQAVDEMIEDCGDVALKDVDRMWVKGMRDAWALRGHRVANVRLSVLANALAPAIDDERIPADPFSRLKRAKTPRGKGEAHPVWDDAEVEIAIETAIAKKRPGLARAIALGRYGGFRRQTICALPLNARVETVDEDGKHIRLSWVTEKKRVLCDKPEDARLTAVMARTPNKALTIAYNADGFPWKERQLNQALDRFMAALAKAGKVRAATDEKGEVYCPLTIHGLRHSRGVELAHHGASDAQIMAQLEHATDRMAKVYRRQADRRKLADDGQKLVDNVVRLKVQNAGKGGT
ncbi:MAG: site-specific integrase [Phenylobacterium sp.]|uniref:site-specific integrase n=1 Tax=Phenylobacterium sp. TaxID=1871053 RepID=UPI001A28E4F8|nr:site-specific integrase [Phenylobacterium sp.]MBJ7412504.1 site-specific integrase [Phenylobacterium sp.]